MTSYLVEEFPDCVDQESALHTIIDGRGFWIADDLGEWLNLVTTFGTHKDSVRCAAIIPSRNGGLIIVWEDSEDELTVESLMREISEQKPVVARRGRDDS